MMTINKKSLVGLIAAVALLSATFGYGGGVVANHLTQDSFPKAPIKQEPEVGLSIAQIAEKNRVSVVEIHTEQVVYDTWMQEYITEGAGSGIIISPEGHIITNNHVVEGAGKIIVTLSNGDDFTAMVIGRDEQTDIAVIKIGGATLTPAIYGNSDTIAVGDLALVIGNPLGALGGSVSAGIISALDRELTIDGKTMTLLQTDASINPGNSGGGMFNGQGELIGMVVAKSAGSNVEGLGFSIPSNVLKEIGGQLMEKGYVRGRIDTGMTFIDLTQMQNALRYGVMRLGIYVERVDRENAIQAGFQPGDMLYKVGETLINTETDLKNALLPYSVGDTVPVQVVRESQRLETELTLLEKGSR